MAEKFGTRWVLRARTAGGGKVPAAGRRRGRDSLGLKRVGRRWTLRARAAGVGKRGSPERVPIAVAEQVGTRWVLRARTAGVGKGPAAVSQET